jgi:hypothetical protein
MRAEGGQRPKALPLGYFVVAFQAERRRIQPARAVMQGESLDPQTRPGSAGASPSRDQDRCGIDGVATCLARLSRRFAPHAQPWLGVTHFVPLTLTSEGRSSNRQNEVPPV